MPVRMVEVAESMCMMSAAYRGGPPLSTHILCLLGIWPDEHIPAERGRDRAMPARHRASQIVAVELIGFLAIIALSWANELFGLPSLIFGGGHRVNWPESVLETAIIALVAIPVLVLTGRLVLRLHYLEEFLRVCSWCRKLSAGNEWIPVEEFFERTFDTRTSHGMCPTCLAEQKGKLRRAS